MSLYCYGPPHPRAKSEHELALLTHFWQIFPFETPLKLLVLFFFKGYKIKKVARNGLTLNGILDTGSNSCFLEFSEGNKEKNWPKIS